MSKNKNKKSNFVESTDANTNADALIDNTPVVKDIEAVAEATSVAVTAIPLNADGYVCEQIKGKWVLEKAVLKIGLEGVKNKDVFLAKVKAEMNKAGITTYQSSRYKGLEITDEKVKQRIAYVTQNIGGKNPEHRWTLLSVNTENGIKFEAAPMPIKLVEKLAE